MEIELIQRSEEWLEFRRNKIGASDAPVIMKVSPWKSPYVLWQEKMLLKSSYVNAAMMRGNALEENARHSYNVIRRDMYVPCVYQSEEYPWMIASMDGMNLDRNKAVEIKCAGKKDHDIAKEGNVPEKYYPQLQHQMFVCGLSEMDYFSYHYLDNVEDIATVKVLRDDDYIKTLIEREKEFYDCLINFIPPEIGPDDYTHTSDPKWEKTANRWLAVRDNMDNLKKEEEELREELEQLSKGNNTSGAGIKLSYFTRQGAVDYSSIPEIQNTNLDLYRKKSTTATRITKDAN